MKRVLIANRGEIACRVIAACRALGIETVAVYLRRRPTARHVRLADDGRRIGAVARSTRATSTSTPCSMPRAPPAPTRSIPATASSPRTPRFAEAVTQAGLVWIGPAPETIAAMGDKGRARAIAATAGVPVLPGSATLRRGDAPARRRAARPIGFPLLVKAAGGGGGIGMRRVDRPEDLADVVEATQGMAERAFGDGTVYLERYVPHGAPRRGPGLRLRRRPRRPSLRARLLDPAPLPEGDRGEPAPALDAAHASRDDRRRGRARRAARTTPAPAPSSSSSTPTPATSTSSR